MIAETLSVADVICIVLLVIASLFVLGTGIIEAAYWLVRRIRRMRWWQ